MQMFVALLLPSMCTCAHPSVLGLGSFVGPLILRLLSLRSSLVVGCLSVCGGGSSVCGGRSWSSMAVGVGLLLALAFGRARWGVGRRFVAFAVGRAAAGVAGFSSLSVVPSSSWVRGLVRRAAVAFGGFFFGGA